MHYDQTRRMFEPRRIRQCGCTKCVARRLHREWTTSARDIVIAQPKYMVAKANELLEKSTEDEPHYWTSDSERF